MKSCSYIIFVRILIVLIALCSIGYPAFSQKYVLDGGKDDYHKILSSDLQATSASPVVSSFPFSHIANPALNAGMQRYHLGANYSGMFSTDEGYSGHIVSLGVGTPTKFGNITASTHFLTADFESIEYGSVGTVHASFSKDITDQFDFGLGIGGGYATLDSQSDWMLSLDIGGVYRLEFVSLPHVQVGGVLRNLGKWIQFDENSGAFPPPFTVAGGLEVGLVESDSLSLAVRSNMEFPSVQNVRVDMGVTAGLFQLVDITSSWQLDVGRLLDESSAQASWIPTVGLGITVPLQGFQFNAASERDIDKGAELTLSPTVFPMVDDVWTGGLGATIAFGSIDDTGPIISYQLTDESRHVSPNNDGIQDTLLFDFSITDESILDSYAIEIWNEDSTLVKTIRNTRERPDSIELDSFFNRLFEVDNGIEVPETIVWDGRTDEGVIAADGPYTVKAIAMDDNENTTTVSIGEIFVDSTFPTADVSWGSPLLFSPNGDGNLDVIEIVQSGSEEIFWVGSITDVSGDIRNSFSWNDGEPEMFSWDGTQFDGSLVDDGVYTYTLVGRDSAGNEETMTIENIVVRTDDTPLDLRISTSAFSPNGDEIQDLMRIFPIIGSTNGISEWRLIIYDRDTSDEVYRVDGDSPSNEILFDGYSNGGVLLSDGAYFAELQLFYSFGNRPRVISPTFFIDTGAPFVDVSSDTTVISPNGDGVQDGFIAGISSSSEHLWTIELQDEDRNRVFFREWSDILPDIFEWDARNQLGRIVNDGQYQLVISATDLAGNTTVNSDISVLVDTTESEITISPERLSFSPNGDGVMDSIRVFARLSSFQNQAVSYQFEIQDGAGAVVYRAAKNDRLPNTFAWNGQTIGNQLGSNGEYTANLFVQLPNGNRSSAKSVPFSLDTIAPSLDVDIAYTVFSPDEDGLKDTLPISLQSSKEDEWIIEITDEETAAPVFSRRINDASLTDFAWNGRDNDGNRLDDGLYSIAISSKDEAGNETETNLENIRVRTTDPAVIVLLESYQASPNGDGLEDSIPINVSLTSVEGLEQWELAILDAEGVIQKIISGEDKENTVSYSWDGSNDSNVMLDGIYTASFTAVYDHGPTPSAVSRPFLIDTTPPEVTLITRPLPFSPDADGVNDELFVELDIRDISPIKDWGFTIFDRSDTVFQSLSGNGRPSNRLRWDGNGLDGTSVVSAEDYPYVFSITDALGNNTVVDGSIPVDILVFRDGDRLRIQISAINFEPFSSVLVLDNSVQGVKNTAILERLTTIFQKYSSYRIQIEGHAVNLSGTSREEVEELAPLSAARADAVKFELAKRGISSSRILSIGLGGTAPIVPHTDEQNRWKNRRVEFILLRRQ